MSFVYRERSLSWVGSQICTHTTWMISMHNQFISYFWWKLCGSYSVTGLKLQMLFVIFKSLSHKGNLKYIATLKFNPFVPSSPFFCPLKTSKNVTVFWCFQGVEKGCIGNKWVNLQCKTRSKMCSVCEIQYIYIEDFSTTENSY